jgi:Na+-driven multidrug efflux pump|eukprot:COSAG01_NODE_2535_length_7489_cov_14.116644_3_plen_189_part_00
MRAQGDAGQAREAAWLGIYMNTGLAAVSSLLYFLLSLVGPGVARALTSNMEVVQLVNSSALPTALSMVGFAIMMTVRTSCLAVCDDDARKCMLLYRGLWYARLHAACLQAIQLLNACGRNKWGTLIAFVGCWVVGVSSSAMFGLTCGQGLRGIWWGNALGLLVGAAIGWWFLRKLDWEREVIRARATK